MSRSCQRHSSPCDQIEWHAPGPSHISSEPIWLRWGIAEDPFCPWQRTSTSPLRLLQNHNLGRHTLDRCRTVRLRRIQRGGHVELESKSPADVCLISHRHNFPQTGMLAKPNRTRDFPSFHTRSRNLETLNIALISLYQVASLRPCRRSACTLWVRPHRWWTCAPAPALQWGQWSDGDPHGWCHWPV